MTIGFAKIGGKMYFDNNSWRGTGGFSEAVNIIKILSQEHTIILLSTTDIDKYKSSSNYKGDLENVKNYHKSKILPKMDKLVMLNGLLGEYNNINPVTKKPALNMFRHGAYPILQLINKLKLPWIYLLTDSRYPISVTKDLETQPIISLSQYEDKENNIEYGYLEEAWLYGKEPHKVKYKDCLNENSIDFYFNRKGKRTNMITKFIKKSKYKITLYGNYPNSEIIKEKDLGVFYDCTKYTLNTSLDTQWITQKYNEFAYHNIIQFAYNYDSQNIKYKEYDFLRVNSVEEFDKKIKYLEKHKDYYHELLDNQKISDDAIKGKNILNSINKYLYEK